MPGNRLGLIWASTRRYVKECWIWICTYVFSSFISEGAFCIWLWGSVNKRLNVWPQGIKAICIKAERGIIRYLICRCLNYCVSSQGLPLRVCFDVCVFFCWHVFNIASKRCLLFKRFCDSPSELRRIWFSAIPSQGQILGWERCVRNLFWAFAAHRDLQPTATQNNIDQIPVNLNLSRWFSYLSDLPGCFSSTPFIRSSVFSCTGQTPSAGLAFRSQFAGH